MKTFVVYDARREQVFVRFPRDGVTTAESGHLAAGLWAEFGTGDPARLFTLVVDHPFFARATAFVDRMTALAGSAVVRRIGECHLRDETVVDEVDVQAHDLQALMSAWASARQELRDRRPHPEPPPADVRRQEELGKRWLVPARLEPVIARTAQHLPTAVGEAFDGRVEVPADLADALSIERVVRVTITNGVIRLRGRVRDGEEPPTEARLGVVGAGVDAVVTYDPDLDEVWAELELDGPLSKSHDGEVVSLLTLRVRRERTG